MKCPCPALTAPTRGARLPALLLAATLALAACSKADDKKAAAPAGPKEVGVVTLQPERLAVTTELPGRTSARLVAEIRPQVGGIVQKRLFTEGSMVKAGDVLYLIEPASFQATFNSAQASLRKAEAAVAVAQTTARRNAELVKIDAISQQANEQSQAALQQAEADLGMARATLETARINLGFTRITAPISGRVGLSTVTPGALVTANQATALVVTPAGATLSTYPGPDPRSRRIVEARWLAEDPDGKVGSATLHDLADEFGVSAERIRQIESAAMKKMKAALVSYQ